MADLGLDLNRASLNFGDLELGDDNDLVIVDGTEAILQNIVQNIRWFFSEWFLNTADGMPYYQQILVKNPDQGTIDALFQNRILGTPGVVALTSYSFSPNFVTRQLSISFTVRTTSGTVDYAGLINV